MSRYLVQFSGKLLCLVCAREVSHRAARLHGLTCKRGPASGVEKRVTGGFVSDGESVYELTPDASGELVERVITR